MRTFAGGCRTGVLGEAGPGLRSPASGDPCGANHNSWREVYYDDAQSLGLKYGLVNASQLRGAGIWALGYDGASRDLWNVLSAKFA